MRIFTKIVLQMLDNPEAYGIIEKIGYEYQGPISLACGATPQQNQIEGSQQSFMAQAQQQASTVFSGSSQVFNGLMATFAPTVAAGPNQQGFSATEDANLKSQAVTQTGASFRNARQELGENLAASGGGNTALPSGVAANEETQLAEAGAGQTASQLGQIQEANYATGRQNYENAVQGELAAPGAFNAATTALGGANQSGEAAANTANQIATQNNSWVQGVTGALGAIGGSFATGGLNTLLNNSGGGGSSSGIPADQAPYGPNSD